jgi:hypothetical protein
MWWWWKPAIAWNPADVNLTQPLSVDLDALFILVVSSIVIHFLRIGFLCTSLILTRLHICRPLRSWILLCKREIEKEAFRLELRRFKSKFMEVHEPCTPLDVIKLFEDNPDLVDSILKINEGVPIFFS